MIKNIEEILISDKNKKKKKMDNKTLTKTTNKEKTQKDR